MRIARGRHMPPTGAPQVRARALPPGAVRWSQVMEPLTDGTTRTRWAAVDQTGQEVPEPPPGRGSLLSGMPWASIRHRMRYVVRPWLAAGGVAGVAALVESYQVPPGGVLAATAAAGVAVYRVAPRLLIRGEATSRTGERAGDGEPRGRRPSLSDLAARSADLVRRRRRLAIYLTVTAGVWVTWADVAGLDPAVDGRWAVVSWGLWATLTAVGGKPYWNHRRARPEPTVEPDVAEPGFGQLIALRWVSTVGAVAEAARMLPSKVAGEPPREVAAVAAGKLPGTLLEDVHRVAGGWAATAVDPLQRGLAWTGEAQNGQQVGPRRQIAAVFGAGLAAVTLEPDAEDANRCFVMVQKQSPLRDIVRWEGPGSIDPVGGTGMFGRYADGTTARYEVYRRNFGCPHDGLFGTTGSGKSETFQILMVNDRWMHYTDSQGRKHGMVADFLIDPQHGQSFGPFLDDLAAPVASTLEEAMMLVDAFTREGLRRNEYLATVPWVDEKGRARKGRKWWDPLVDGPMLVLNIDEAHFFLASKPFAALITAAARMWRKCGMKIRIGTHTPLLADLGGSMALRDMLTGGFVWIGRTANSLTGPTAFNGQLPVDPRSIPKVPGAAYAMAGANPRAMLLRSAWEPDFYDWVRDDDDRPIGFPAALPQVTLDTFGPEFAAWRATGALAQSAASAAAEPVSDQRAEDAVLEVLLAASDPLTPDELDRALEPYRQRGVRVVLRTARAAITRFKADGLLEPTHGRYQLTAEARERLLAERAEMVGAQ